VPIENLNAVFDEPVLGNRRALFLYVPYKSASEEYLFDGCYMDKCSNHFFKVAQRQYFGKRL